MVPLFSFQALLEFFSLCFQNNLKVLSSNFMFFFLSIVSHHLNGWWFKLINQMKWFLMEKTWPQAIYVWGWNYFWKMNLSPWIGWIPCMHYVYLQWHELFLNVKWSNSFWNFLMNEWNNWMEVHVVCNEICYHYGISPIHLFRPTK
jgi:hypothetical protein